MRTHNRTRRYTTDFVNYVLTYSNSFTAIAVDRKTYRGLKFTINEGERDRVLRSLRYYNARGREIYALLPDGFVVIDDVSYPRMLKIRRSGLFTILETHSGSYHLISYVGKYDKDTLIQLRSVFKGDPGNSGHSTRIPGFKNHKRKSWVNLITLQKRVPKDLLTETLIYIYGSFVSLRLK